MIDDFDLSTLNAHQTALLAQTTEKQKEWFDKLSSAEKVEVMALHTGATPEGDRPLMPKPVPKYIGSRDMLHMLWRKSEWKPDPDFDYGLDHAIGTDPEMLGFLKWIVMLVKIGRLQAYARLEGDEYREAKITDYADATIHGALLKGNRVACDVRIAITDENAFQRNILPMRPANCALWFRKCDIDKLSCDETALEHDMETVKQLDAHAPIAAVIEADSQPGLAIATTKHDPVIATADGLGSTSHMGNGKIGVVSTPLLENEKERFIGETLSQVIAAQDAPNTFYPSDLLNQIGEKILSKGHGPATKSLRAFALAIASNLRSKSTLAVDQIGESLRHNKHVKAMWDAYKLKISA